MGSSRRDGDFATSPDDETVRAILGEASTWLPHLKPVLEGSMAEVKVRLGPRPVSKRGKPYIGLVPGLNGLVLAAGHEGSGLMMALSTAEIVSSLLGVSSATPLNPCFKMCAPSRISLMCIVCIA